MDTDSAQWYDVVGKFKAYATQFTNAYSALMNSENVARKNPALYAEWKALKAKADGVKATVQKLTGSVDSAAGWLKSTFGLNGLGVLPALVPVAVVVAGVASMSYVIADITKFLAKMKQFETVSNQVGPEKAASIVNQTNPNTGVFSSIGASAQSVAVLAVILAGIYYLPKLIGKR